MKINMSQLIYLDHNATTYIDHSVAEAIRPYLFNHFANPSSIYSISQSVRKDLENAREHMAEMLGVKQGQIIFTSGGSESDNMAIKGAAFARSHKGKHIITSTIEHHAVLNSCAYLEKHGFEVSYISVDNQGVLNVEELEKAIRPDTILISIMAANNETGVIQPLEAVSGLAKKNGIPFHSDAVQIGGKIKIDIGNLGVDLLSLSAHKFYGPKGVGLLYINKGIQIDPLIHGGLQENGKRAGTENLAGIIGMEKALELCMNNYEVESDRETKLRDKLEKEILQIIPECMVNGQKASRLPNTLNIIFKFVEGEGMILLLDKEGICVSSGSACTSGSLEPSHVLLAMGVPHEHAHGSLRFSLGKNTTEEDINKVIKVLPGIIEKLRAMSPLWEG